jgi:hypothetical protein
MAYTNGDLSTIICIPPTSRLIASFKCYIRLKMLFMDEHSSLSCCSINNAEKGYNIDTRGKCYKTFYGRNLRILAISKSVFPWQAYPANSNKH